MLTMEDALQIASDVTQTRRPTNLNVGEATLSDVGVETAEGVKELVRAALKHPTFIRNHRPGEIRDLANLLATPEASINDFASYVKFLSGAKLCENPNYPHPQPYPYPPHCHCGAPVR